MQMTQHEGKKVLPQTMRIRHKKFLLNSEAALQQLQQCLEDPLIHNKKTLEFIMAELYKMREVLSISVFKPIYPLYVVDNWHNKEELGDQLLKVYYDYLDLE